MSRYDDFEYTSVYYNKSVSRIIENKKETNNYKHSENSSRRRARISPIVLIIMFVFCPPLFFILLFLDGFTK